MERYKSIYDEKALTTKQRNELPDSKFALPKDRKYPIPDEVHARNALARVAANGTSAEIAKVKSAVKSKFKDIEVSED